MQNTVKVAVAQAASVFFDKAASIKKAGSIIKEAAKNGAKLVLLPEAFISGYPRGLNFASVIGSRGQKGKEDYARYLNSSVEVPSNDTVTLGKYIKKAGIYAVVGVIERVKGTLYCTILYYAPDGTLLAKHRKLKPTGVERLVWGEGDGSTLSTIKTPFGIVGGLICWENYMPAARMYMYSKHVKIYLAPTADSREAWQATLKHIGREGGCFVLGCNQYFTKSMYPKDLSCYKELEKMPENICLGGSAIIDPYGNYLAGPLWGKEGILYADLHLNLIDEAALDFDPVGHYSSPVFSLQVDTEAHNAVTKK